MAKQNFTSNRIVAPSQERDLRSQKLRLLSEGEVYSVPFAGMPSEGVIQTVNQTKRVAETAFASPKRASAVLRRRPKQAITH